MSFYLSNDYLFITPQRGIKYARNLDVDTKVLFGDKEVEIKKAQDHIGEERYSFCQLIPRFSNPLLVSEDMKVAYFESPDKIEYKPVSELKVGDCIAFDTQGYDGEGGRDVFFDLEPNNGIKPDGLDVDMSWYLGVMGGLGRINNGSYHLSTPNLELVNRSQAIFHKKFGGFVNIRNVSISGKDLYFATYKTRFESWSIKFRCEIRDRNYVPFFMYGASREERFAYLAGIFDSMGEIYTPGVVQLASNTNKGLLEGLMYLLSTLGITSERINYRTEYGDTLRIYGKTNLEKFYDGVYPHTSTDKLNKIFLQTDLDFSYNFNQIEGAKSWVKEPGRYVPVPLLNITQGVFKRTKITFEVDSKDIWYRGFNFKC